MVYSNVSAKSRLTASPKISVENNLRSSRVIKRS